AVYGREGQACPRCGRRIRRMVLGQRSTHFCARCQR
ncbi:MAG: DNA-formamidopyrimidine glycosylase, partial [Chloroflexi bacterium]|nr:DNA-formamidopyrimidine glycosylase [Chloroflexota bacterium]